MSDVGPGTFIKLAYRGFAGFFVLLIMFIFGVLGFSFSLAGGLVIALCWIPIAFPEVLNFPLSVNGEAFFINNPELASVALLVFGIVFLMLGFFFLFFTFIIGKGTIIVDRELSQVVDRAFVSQGSHRISQLERLTVLLEKGVISREEFEEEKAILLSNPHQMQKADYIK